MKTVLVTGATGFLGQNFTTKLESIAGVRVLRADSRTTQPALLAALQECDAVVHLAGVNRPNNPGQFRRINTDLTSQMCDALMGLGRAPKIIFASSIHAEADTPYGISKRQAEEALLRFGAATGAPVHIFRLKNIFGKWSRPNYNSVVATFCHNIARSLPIHISDPNTSLDLTYVDDVVQVFLSQLFPPVLTDGGGNSLSIPFHSVTLSELAGTIQAFHDMQETLLLPDFSSRFHRQLYGTYLSYLPDKGRQTNLKLQSDTRGSLAEFLKSNQAGQIFVSRTALGVTRGNHYHHTKAEKFCVVHGEALVRMRQIFHDSVSEYHLRGSDFQVVDIPPGYTHSIQNIGSEILVTLFWASEIFDPNRPDTYYLPVDRGQASAL